MTSLPFIGFAVALLALSACEVGRSDSPSPEPSASITQGLGVERIQAVVFDARRAPGDSALHAIHELGATHLALVSFGFQEAADSPSIRFSPDARWFSESADGARALAERAGELGMGIIVKPQIWIRGGAWTADIGFDSDADWISWENDYRSYIIHAARLAAEIGADILIVGTELSNSVQQRPTFWRRLIEDVRQVYDGKLTYGANWHDDYLEVPFWDALDMVGVQAYFPLASIPAPDLSTILAGWDNHLSDVRALAARHQRPILFTELGYRSVPYAADEPWRWASRDERVEPDYRLQADLYRGFFETFWHRPWFDGAIIWKFYPEGDRRGRGREVDFTPQGKPAEEVLRTWFTATAG
ncbi:MAG: hypothetical protein WD021_07930 [Rhodothermales bacterium]